MDYYSRLGVNKAASQEDIKKAYKKLAMQHHPDRGGDANVFQQVNEAYETLKNPEKRAQYDQPKPQRQAYNYNANGATMNDIFEHMFRQPRRANADVKLSVTITLEDVHSGKDLIASYKLRNGQPVDASIRIHPGVENGEIIRYKGMGDNTHPHAPRGDLLLQVRVQPHKRFDRDGAHLYTSVNVSLFDLILGTTYVVESIENRPIQVKIPAGTNPGTTLSIAGHGLPSMRRGKPGNLYLKIKGSTPKVKDPTMIKRIQQLNDELGTST